MTKIIKNRCFKSFYKMIDISNKRLSYRRSVASGEIFVGEKAFDLIKKNELQKGNALALSEISGVNAVKKAHELIPLSHQLNIEQVLIYNELIPKDYSIISYCIVTATAKTGVEMEALIGVNASLLTIYDLTKMIDHSSIISNIKLLMKEGGKSGKWESPYGVPVFLKDFLNELKFSGIIGSKNNLLKNINISIIVMSDRASNGIYKDKSGVTLSNIISFLGGNVLSSSIINDNEDIIINKIKEIKLKDSPNIILTTGGTGISSTDSTYLALNKVCDYIIPGIGELLRESGSKYTENSWLSCSVAGMYKKILIVSLPGNPDAIIEGIGAIKIILKHASMLINKVIHD